MRLTTDFLMMNNNKRKIINDPVFGFITIPSPFLYDLIQHPYVQRLSRIKQLGLTSMVYPGCQHTRFQHSIGAMHLMNEAINQLRFKGVEISDNEAEGVLAAILLHDIGHGPFSHVLEYSLVNDITHEELSLMMIEKINEEIDGKLDTAIAIFTNKYPRKFLHQLVSGQLDMDRLDYLCRDSFYSGVVEGSIGADRIIKMLNVAKDSLVVEVKGIYSIEHFLIARRLMYWQVYLHKTGVAAECMLVNVFKRAKELTKQGITLFATPSLAYFLNSEINQKIVNPNDETLQKFIKLDDADIICALKEWSNHPDKVLSTISEHFINRKLFKVKIKNKAFETKELELLKEAYKKQYLLDDNEASYYFSAIPITNDIYNTTNESLKILFKDGSIKNISEASDILNTNVLEEKVTKHYLCYLKT